MEADLLIVPANPSKGHWFLVVANLMQREITTYNSMTSKPKEPGARLAKFLCAVGSDRALPQLQGKWTQKFMNPPAIPAQADGCSCGLFTIAAADCISKGRPPSGYDMSDIPAMRAGILEFIHFKR